MTPEAGNMQHENPVLIASKNSHKITEIKEIFVRLPINFITLSDLQNVPSIVEDGKSFKENAIKKAREICQWSGVTCLADDSGIEVDFLQGTPGIYSARFSGDHATDEDNNSKLMHLLKDTPFAFRTARYRCVMAVATPDGKIETSEGTCEGIIALEPRGVNGFGYDPIFFYPPLSHTFGEIEPDVKNKLSHRYQALIKIKPILLNILEIQETEA